MKSTSRTTARFGAIAVTAAVAGSLALAGPAHGAIAVDTEELRDAVTVEGVRAHQAAFQAIADANDGTRQAGTPGHDESLQYAQQLLDAAGYETWTQEFEYPRVNAATSSVAQTSPEAVVYERLVDWFEMEGGGVADAAVTAVDLDLGLGNASTSGCEAADFDGYPAGHIALLQRGACSFEQKAVNAIDAGASGVIIFNQGDTEDRTPLFGGTLGATFPDIPVVSMPYDLGVDLAGTADLVLRLEIDVEQVVTSNLLADSPTGRTDRTVVVGGHLDSVGEGPGINDNGSGIAAILETALQISELDVDLRNRVRFAFWSGEEDGLLGSYHYVDQLSKSEVKGTAVNLNFDMIGSPNAVNFVYDGDGDAFGLTGPNGSAVVEDVFVDFFDSQGQPTEPTEFSGRSDYAGFIDVGIPAGGLFSGAEGIKTDEQAALFGGTAGDQYDPCYHLACDTYDNVSLDTLDIMSDAVAHATLTFGETTSAVNGTGKGKGKGQAPGMEFRGPDALR